MAAEPLRPRLDVDIAAGLRPERLPDRIAAVRWASQPALGFPTSGYRVFRLERQGGAPLQRTLVGTYELPATDSWPAFEADLLARVPIAGPYFDDVTEDDLGFLLPLIRAVDPRVALTQRLALLPDVAAFFGQIHTTEPFFAALYWGRPTPTLDDVLADPVAGPMITAFYALEVMEFLSALAIRYEYAVLLGLAVEDDITGMGDMSYQMGAWWGTRWGTSFSDGIDGLTVFPTTAPKSVTASVIDGNVGHPAFARTNWEAPAWYVPVDGSGAPVGAEATYPRPFATQTALVWDLPVSETHRLLQADHPVSFRVRSFEHGAGTAGDPAPPPAPPTRSFRDLFPGAVQVPVDGSATHAIDGAGRPWPPLEGWVRYRVWGVSILAVESDDFAETVIDHQDTVAPPPPRLQVIDDRTVTFDGNRTITVKILLGFGSEQDFPTGDAAEFRLETNWTNTLYRAVTVGHTVSTSPTEAVVEVVSFTQVRSLINGWLQVAGRSHRVLDASPTTLTVTLHDGAPPSPGAGVVMHRVPIGERTRVARVVRPPAVSGAVAAIVATEPLTVTLPLGRRRTRGDVSLYLHLLRSSVLAHQDGDDWVVEEPLPGTPAARVLDELRSDGRLAADLPGSPFVLYPTVTATVTIAVPDDFDSGTVTLTARASDAKPYVTGPVVASPDPALAQLDGNEGAGVDAAISVRNTTPPAAPGLLAAPPIQWATSALPYDPVSRFDVRWQPVTGAVRFEVWRLLESALPPRPDGRSDQDLLADAVAAAATAELRTDQAWSTSYVDELPGRAPVRAVYFIRSLSASGVASPFSAPIGPVRVPDVRPPATAEVAAVRRAVPTDDHDGSRQVRVDIAGPELHDPSVGYLVERRPADGSETWQTIIKLTPPVVVTSDGGGASVTAADPDAQPGIEHQWRVTPYRVVLDPVDDAGILTRTINGSPSAGRAGRSTGALLPPTSLRASAGGGAKLRWRNADRYDTVIVERLVGGTGAARVLAELPGTSTTFTDNTNVGPTSTGLSYSYRLRCLAGTASTSTRVEGVIGAP